jgi:splicing factor 3A subunit 1
MGKEDAILNERIRGVIVPPPETKKLIDKAAQLVAKYGSSVEATLKKDEKNLPKFSFFNESDAYRPYFDQKVAEYVKKAMYEKHQEEEKYLGKKTHSSQNLSKINSYNAVQSSSIQNDLKKLIDEKLASKQEAVDVRPPPQDQFSISHPNIGAIEMDIIKATAQYVARNGQRFLTGLSERESKNPQFDFLKPQHTLFGYFTYLVESYAKCLRKEDMVRLSMLAHDKEAVMKRARDRYLWEKKVKESQKKKDSLDELERTQMAQIDWHDYAIVDIIEFTEEELYNTIPILDENQFANNAMIDSVQGNVQNLMGFNKQDQITEINKNNNEEILDPLNKLTAEIDNKLESNGVDKIKEEIPKQIILENKQNINDSLPEPGMKIVKNYVRKTEQINKQEFIKCPLCKENINLEDWPHHIKVELLDPKWKEIQKELQDRKTEINLAPTNEFIGYLSDFSKNRPDLFGDASDVMKIEEKKKNEPKAPTNIWDGYAPHMTRTTANIAMLAQQTRKNYEESRKQDHFQNILPNKPEESQENEEYNFRGLTSNKTLQNNVIPISVTQGEAQLTFNMNKETQKEKNENQLIPEDIFLKKHPKPFKLNVKIPENSNYFNLKGQIITVVVNPKDSISSIKSQIITNLNLPYNELANNSKIISFEGKEFEESESAAFYNFSQGTIIEFLIN